MILSWQEMHKIRSEFDINKQLNLSYEKILYYACSRINDIAVFVMRHNKKRSHEACSGINKNNSNQS